MSNRVVYRHRFGARESSYNIRGNVNNFEVVVDSFSRTSERTRLGLLKREKKLQVSFVSRAIDIREAPGAALPGRGYGSNAGAEVDKRSKIAATYTGIDRASTARLISSLGLGLDFMEPTSPGRAITREFGIKTTPRAQSEMQTGARQELRGYASRTAS